MNVSRTSYIAVVSGLPRSGTSMMMQMLEAGGISVLADHVRAADEDNHRGYYELEAIKRTRSDPSWLKDAPGKAVKVVYLLLYDLPRDYDYRVVFMRRNLREVVASQQAMLARRGDKGADLSPEQMAAVFQRQLEKVDHWLAEQPRFTVLQVDYHRVLADPRREAQHIGDFLESELDVEAMAAAVEPTLHRQRCN